MINLSGKSFGRYHILEPLGQGGMAAVYKAYDNALERNVAIKVIRTDTSDDNDFLKRFKREAKALAQLDHPYILKVLDFGEEEGMPYLVMPYLPGGTLKTKMGGQPMPFKEAARLLAPIARALEYAHKMGIIHRDVKPANILLSQSDEPILSDFGIAKILEGGDSTQLTSTGMGIGTPDYMAPEQWMGKAEARTDIYALGVVFYELIVGRRPYSADTPAAVMLKHVNDPLPRPGESAPDLLEAVEKVIFKSLAKRPEARYQTMGDFAAALENLVHLDVSTASIAAPITPPPPPVHPPDTRTVPPLEAPKSGIKGWQIALIAMGGIAILVGLCFVLGIASLVLNPVKATPISEALSMEATINALEAAPTLKAGADTPVPENTPVELKPATPTPPPAIEPTFKPFDSIPGYPEDVPFLKDNRGDLISSTAQGNDMFMFSTDLSLEKALDFYRSGMKSKGWQEEYYSKDEARKSHMIMYSKNQRSVMISLSPNPSTQKTAGKVMVMISLVKQ